MVQRQAKRVADVVLSTLALNCPTLAAVVIKTTWHITDTGPPVHAFLKSKQTDLYGRTTIVDMAVEPHMVKHHEPLLKTSWKARNSSLSGYRRRAVHKAQHDGINICIPRAGLDGRKGKEKHDGSIISNHDTETSNDGRECAV
jgi:hypothetical protein